MALSRIQGEEDLYVGGVFALRKPALVEEKNITSILSVLKYSFVNWDGFDEKYRHMSIDIDDMEDQDILVHLPRMVRFIEEGLYGENGFGQTVSGDAVGSTAVRPGQLKLESSPKVQQPVGAVFVHCAMGKSRSVTAVIAYLLWKYPHRYGSAAHRRPDRGAAAADAVMAALKWVRQTREIAEPNPGFMKQLELWWDMGCPAESDDAVERNVKYQRWLYRREVEESARLGRAPDRLRFEDEDDVSVADAGASGGIVRTTGEDAADTAGQAGQAGPGRTNQQQSRGLQVRCKKCRRVLATHPFVVPHRREAAQNCPHVFIEPLSWMRPTLEAGELDGRLVCPNAKCSATVGRYAWQGFKCSCGEWVCPAFSLQRSKIDEFATKASLDMRPNDAVQREAGAILNAGIRMPPTPRAAAESSSRQENL